MLWARLRGRRYAGIKFRRQQPVGKYIADYYCADAKIILELDGDSHVGRERLDTRRDAWFASEGIKVIRVWDNEIFTNLDGVLELIFNTFRERQTFPLTPNPSPPLGRGEPNRGT